MKTVPRLLATIYLLCSGISRGSAVYWELTDLIREADIIAVGDIVRLGPENGDWMQVALGDLRILKAVGTAPREITLSVLSPEFQARIDEPVASFTPGARYLVFAKRRTSPPGEPSLELVAPTSGAVRLQNEETIRRAGLLDGYFPRFVQFDEGRLIQRIEELIVEGPCWPPAPDRGAELRARGCPSETEAEILQAMRSRDITIRLLALGLLAQRQRLDAIPQLREALNDPSVQMRWHAAHWLGRLGDKSGLEPMRKDFAQLAEEANRLDLGSGRTPDGVTVPGDGKNAGSSLLYALDVARVLAELGDWRGYELAREVLSQGASAEQRYRAATVLIEMAKADEAPLRTGSIDPVSVLSTAAEQERDQDVFYRVVNVIAETLPGKAALPILAVAKESRNQSKGMRSIARTSYEGIRARMTSHPLK